MITIDVGRPSELTRSLRILKAVNIGVLQIQTKTHFWHTGDDLQELASEINKLRNLEHLEIKGDSYPDLMNACEFLSFLALGNEKLKSLKMPILPPFPGQFRVQDKTFMTNKIIHLVHGHRSISRVIFYTENGEDNEWVNGMNAKMRSILRNRGGETSRL